MQVVATAVIILCHCERSDATLGRSPPLRHATRATSPVSSGESTPGRVYYRGAVTPVPLIRGLPRSNFVLLRRDRKNRHATRATSPVSSGESTPGRAVFDYCHCETRLRVVAILLVIHCHCERVKRAWQSPGRGITSE